MKDTYRLDEVIGKGGMGAVYRASHTRLGRNFAVKVFSASAEAGDARARFRREARVTSALGHPNIVAVVDTDETPDGIDFIIMELLEGEELGDRLEREGRMGLAATASIFEQTASALSTAHGAGVIHRDLKPQNIFLCNRDGRDDFVKVLDFGISKVLGSQSIRTKTRMVLGSPAYMSPEQAQGQTVSVEGTTDVYSLAVITWEMLAGQPPFSSPSIPRLLYQVITTNPPPLADFVEGIPRDVEATLQRAMAKDPAARFPSMNTFCEVLLDAVEQAGSSSPVPPVPMDRPAAAQRTTTVLDPGDADDGDTVIMDSPPEMEPDDEPA